MLAIGTETDGSIVCPSNNNGIVGLKPTVGLISRSGIIPISVNQDTPGPMGRTVADVAAALGPLTGIDPQDPFTLESGGRSCNDYRSFLKKEGLRGKRLGLLKSEMGYSERVDSIIMRAVAKMRSAGAEVIIIKTPKIDLGEASYLVLLYEFKDGINKYLRAVNMGGSPQNLKELIEFNRKDSVELRYFDQKIFEQAEAKGDLNTREYSESLNKIRKTTREEGIDKIMKQYNLDAILEPTGAPAWKTDLVLGDHFVGGSSSLAAVAGYPSITVPAGFVRDLPVGLSFTGKAWSEPLLIEIAYAFEQVSKERRPPKFIVSDFPVRN
jgi:amidase